MKKLVTMAVAVIVLAAGLFYGAAGAGVQAKEPKILEFDTMVGVPPAYVSSANNPIRGFNGGGRPWIVGSAHGELKQSGKLELSITGLVFDPNDPGVVTAGLANRNTLASFRAIVSCQTAAGGTAFAETDPFPAIVGPASAGGGNASVEAQLALPQPCLAPIVFVTSPNRAWLAITGH